MTLKEFSGCWVISKDIESLRERIEIIRAKAEKITPSYSQTGGGKGVTSDKVGTYASLLAELENELRAQETKLVEEQLRLTKVFNSIDEPVIRSALRLKYCDMLTWRQVCGRLGWYQSEDALRIACQRFLEKF